MCSNIPYYAADILFDHLLTLSHRNGELIEEITQNCIKINLVDIGIFFKLGYIGRSLHASSLPQMTIFYD